MTNGNFRLLQSMKGQKMNPLSGTLTGSGKTRWSESTRKGIGALWRIEMSEQWYEVWLNGPAIKPVAVDRSTDKCVWRDGRRSLRISDYLCYFQAFDEAKGYLVSYWDDKVESAVKQVEYLGERLAKARMIRV
jgi:hypothetical protein